MPSSPYPDQPSSQLVVRQPKRRGVALSCAECRRSVLSCPCSLTTGKGNRFVLANTEALHEKITVLANRVRQLEDSLATAHSLTSSSPHPLLSEELLQIKRPLERERLDAPTPQEKPDSGDAIDSLGSLSISTGGKSSFYGSAANAWNEEGSDENEDPPTMTDAEVMGPSDPAWYTFSFPFAEPIPQTALTLRDTIMTALPDPTSARRLADLYYQHAAWMYVHFPPSFIFSLKPRHSSLYFYHCTDLQPFRYEPITERDFFETIFRVVYPSSTPEIYAASSPSPMEDPASPDGVAASPAASDSHNQVVSAQNLAVLCMIMGIGVLLDLDRQAHDPLAMKYYHLGRLALSIESVMEEQSIAAIQALVGPFLFIRYIINSFYVLLFSCFPLLILLMCHFMFLSEMGGPRWVIMGMVVKLAQSVRASLSFFYLLTWVMTSIIDDRDSGKWKLNAEQSQKRRELFYELLTYDSWQSLTFGRPPSLSSAHIDCELPHEVVKGENGDVDMSFAAWKHRFSAQCLSVVHDQAFGSRAPNYKLIQDLDRKVRQWYVPPNLQVPGFGGKSLGTSSGEVERPSVQLTMQRYIAFAIKEITLFYMHRGFFAQALEDSPSDPMGSKYSPSVLAAYTSATSFVGLVESLFKQHPQLTERMWFLFTHVFSCAIVLGSIAAKSEMRLARSALSHLESAYMLFTKVSDKTRAGKILPILAKLRERAHQSLNDGSGLSGGHLTLPNEHSSRSSRIKSDPDEISSALGGGTRLVSRRTSGSPSVAASSPPSQHSPPPSTGFLGPDDRLFASPSLSGSALSMGVNPGYSSHGSSSNSGSISGRGPGRGESPGSWPNYTHIQNLNVNINMADAYYPSSSTGGLQQAQDTMLYQMPGAFPPIQHHQQQQQFQHSSHPQHMQMQMQQHQSQHQNPMLMDLGSDSYFTTGGYGVNYGAGGYGMMAQTNDLGNVPDFQESWSTLVASQYKYPHSFLPPPSIYNRMPPISPNQPSMPTNSSATPTKKRRKGATRLSCAECRRYPGSLTTGQGNRRFVLATTQELHEKISELATRVRELEDALRESHAHISTDNHPLLSDELLKIKAPLQRDISQIRPQNSTTVKDEENSDVAGAFGSLKINMSGGAKYFGQIANSWYFLQNEQAEGDNDGEASVASDQLRVLQSILPASILKRALSLPIAKVSKDHVELVKDNPGLRNLCWYLPPADRALHLRSTFYTHAAWMYNPINMETFDTEVYSHFYSPTDTASVNDEPYVAHRLSLMFIVLAIGALMDTTLPAYNMEAEKYHQLARAALFQFDFFDDPTINAVQALFFMTYYLFLSDRNGSSSGARWVIMGIAVKVGQSIGLHRDSGKLTADSLETQHRRETFWELFTYDSWQCLTFGRPPSLALPHFDTKLPYANDSSDEHAFHAWKHRFTSECMSLLHDQAFGAKTPTYATVLQLDRKLRAFPVPPILQVAGFGNMEPRQGGPFPDTPALILQRHVVLALREMNLLYLHRSFFARAISDHPKDPLGSPYGTSVIAAYRSAGSLVAMMRNLHSQLKDPSERIWFLWTHMFSCAIILGSIVTRCPSMSLAPSALVQLDSACELFLKTAYGFNAQKVLKIMLDLRERAHASLEEYQRGKGTPVNRYNTAPVSPDADNDELSLLGGKPRLISPKDPSSPSLTERSPNSHNPIVPLPLSPNLQNNPYIIEYLGSFGNNNVGVNHGQHPMASGSNGAYPQAPGSATTQSSFSEMDLSPVQMYGMSTTSSNNTYTTEPSSYGGQQSMHGLMESNVRHQELPQYFPVYDYGTTAGYNSNAFNSSMVLDPNPAPTHRRSSGSPQADPSIHSIWGDFVKGLTVQ
ncbi:hypothetical protein CVT24_011208 [Panaeolus cyanescens]|uniref:Xylanolytic transcriptional activator regulatory domain-containing protein n=1 Tax=Panaeolus cyanescens TaxID=181874 RepID=A0A409VHZ6_9AGAR|nr:hypothetical protein CVT24_011208 [Panaeolus cyanescens]